MKFVELKKSLMSQVENCYLIFGEDVFLINSAVELIEKSLFKEIVRNNLNKQVFSTEEMDNFAFFDSLNSFPFFADKKLVVLKHFDGKLSNDIISQLKQYLLAPNASTVLCIVCMQDASAFESIKKNCMQVDCSRLDRANIERWIKSKLKIYQQTNPDVNINQDALSLLVDYTNGYLSKIALEIDKLIALSGGHITSEHVKTLVSKDLEYSIFELTNCLSSGNFKRAILIKEDLMSNRKTMNSVISVIQNYYRRLFYSLVSNEPVSEIAKMLKVKESAVLIAKDQAKKVGAKKLKTIVETCAELDYKIKSSLISLENATEYLLGIIIAG